MDKCRLNLKSPHQKWRERVSVVRRQAGGRVGRKEGGREGGKETGVEPIN